MKKFKTFFAFAALLFLSVQGLASEHEKKVKKVPVRSVLCVTAAFLMPFLSCFFSYGMACMGMPQYQNRGCIILNEMMRCLCALVGAAYGDWATQLIREPKDFPYKKKAANYGFYTAFSVCATISVIKCCL